ncbi:MAG: stress response translation initiation inhibitor YciH [Desulfuromonadaceae bacterium]|nr:stress response translation initiation inhibitor YciH [Desulfuromonadaceae bacterium]
MSSDEFRTVWSDGQGRTRPEKNRRSADTAPPVPHDGIVRIGRKTKGRKGKGVTLIYGVPLSGEALKQLAKELKQKCGSGGTLKDGVIEIQGDHRTVLQAELVKKGWTVKLAGS